MKKFLMLVVLFLLSSDLIYPQSSLSYNDHARILRNIKVDYESGVYKNALDSCVYLLKQKKIHPDNRFSAYYYSSAISIYNGNSTFSDYFIRQAKNYLPQDSIPCRQYTKYELLNAEYLTESRKYDEALTSLKKLTNTLDGCNNELIYNTRINYHRVKALASNERGDVVDSLLQEAVELAKISDSVALDTTLSNRNRHQNYVKLYQAEIYWRSAWSILDNAPNPNDKQKKMMNENAKMAILKLESLDISKDKEYRRIKLLSTLLKAQILGCIRPDKDPVSSPVMNEYFDFRPIEAMSILLECSSSSNRNKYQIFKEFYLIDHYKRQLILIYWEYSNEVKNGEERYKSLESVLMELSKDLNFRDVYGYLPKTSLSGNSELPYPSAFLVEREEELQEEKEQVKEEKEQVKSTEQVLETRITIFWGGIILLLFPFAAIIWLTYKFARQSAKVRKKDAEIEASLHFIEEIQDGHAEISEELGQVKSKGARKKKELNAEITQKKEDIKHLKMELSHRLINHLLYLTSTIESDAKNESIGREKLATNAVTRLRHAIKLQRVLEDYDNRTSVYFPAYFNAMQQVVSQAFTMSIYLDCTEVGVEKRIPYDFARDLGQLILEWLFLLADVSVNKIQILAEPASDHMILSIALSEEDWKKMGKPMEISDLQKENSNISSKIGFYLRKYHRGEDPLFTAEKTKDGVSFVSIFHFK